MCVYSAIMDYGREVPIDKWTQGGWDRWKDLLDAAEKADEELEQPDCEDPKKAEWMKEMEERMQRIEEDAGINLVPDDDDDDLKVVFP